MQQRAVVPDTVEGTLKREAGGGWLDSISGGNQFMSAGIGVMAIGAVLAVARQSIRQAAALAKRQMLGIWKLVCEI